MSATDPLQPGPAVRIRARQAGVAAVEFALVATTFFIILFGIIELARAMYMFNTLAEVTRRAARAAANTDFRDQAAIDLVRRRAVFAEGSGNLLLGHPVTYKNVRIEYLYLGSSAGRLELLPIPAWSMPSCPAKNRLNCMTDTSSANCIRAVRARVCQEEESGGACTQIGYQTMVSIVPMPFRLPTSTTIVNAETLGYRSGDAPCP